MTEKKAIAIAAVLGGVLLVLMIVVLRPFSRFEEEYPMAAVSGPAAEPTDGPPAEDTAPAPADEAVSGGAAGQEGTDSGFINATGNTLESRINTPQGFTRTSESANSLGTFLREYKLKKDGSPVLLYNKEPKSNEEAHVAVFKLPIEKEDLQQCADSVMRVYAEYYLKKGEYDKILFSLTDDFKASYVKWREGYRIVESGDSFEWQDLAESDTSYKSFKKFMRVVFAYAGTYTLQMDSHKIKPKKLRIGDVFLHAGAPGHVVMVVDTCEDADGNKAFLLAQGYMPAQQFHVLKNPAHEEDPWYYVSELTYPFETPEYTFDKPCLYRPDFGR